MNERDVQRALGEPYAFGLLGWPAVIAAFAFPDALGGYARWLLIGYLVLVHLGSYGGGRGLGFGNAVLLMSGCVALIAWLHPSPWSLACIPLLLLTILAAQRLRWRQFTETGVAPDASPDDAP